MEERASDIPTESHCDPGTKVDGRDGETHLHQRDEQHHQAGSPDIPVVALGHALVDDVGEQPGQIERSNGLHELQPNHHRQH